MAGFSPAGEVATRSFTVDVPSGVERARRERRVEEG
jgi:hypothetical protein